MLKTRKTSISSKNLPSHFTDTSQKETPMPSDQFEQLLMQRLDRLEEKLDQGAWGSSESGSRSGVAPREPPSFPSRLRPPLSPPLECRGGQCISCLATFLPPRSPAGPLPRAGPGQGCFRAGHSPGPQEASHQVPPGERLPRARRPPAAGPPFSPLLI